MKFLLIDLLVYWTLPIFRTSKSNRIFFCPQLKFLQKGCLTGVIRKISFQILRTRIGLLVNKRTRDLPNTKEYKLVYCCFRGASLYVVLKTVTYKYVI
jgi:hypothetical protein